MKKRANPNARDDEGATALVRAALVCQPSVLTQLLDRGADINASDEQGRTPLVFAIQRDPPDRDFARRQIEVIRLLLSRKADPSLKDADGNTVIHYAARQRNADVLKMMLALGVPADGRHKDGATPLFVAASDGREPQNVQALIAAGADVNAKDNDGRTVLAVTTSRDIASLLEARGARAEAPAPRAQVDEIRKVVIGVLPVAARIRGMKGAIPDALERVRRDEFFRSVAEQYTQELRARDLETRATVRLTTDGRSAMPLWTPDGTRLIISSVGATGRSLAHLAVNGTAKPEPIPVPPTFLSGASKFPASWADGGRTIPRRRQPSRLVAHRTRALLSPRDSDHGGVRDAR